MSDIFREQLETLAQQVHDQGLPPGKCSGDVLYDVLHQYDTTAPDRERERLALALVESLTVTGRRCPENCILQPSCYYLADGAKLPCLVLRERCIQLGILPAEEAK